MSLTNFLLNKQPLLKKKLHIAKIKTPAEEYIKKSLKQSLMFGGAAAIFLFFIMGRDNPVILQPLIAGIVVFYLFYRLNIKKIDVAIRKQAKAIDREVLFAGRFLLIKLNSGKPLINALEEASSGFGAATDYFKDIMKQIQLGTPLEVALERATEYCPSNSLKKILFQITNALKIGVDVTNFLQAILNEIAEQQLTDIMKYGKKLSSLTMFYMLAAVVVPSLGMTLLTVVASMIGLPIDMTAFLVIALFLLFLQYIFITLFRSARPNMDV